MSRGTGCSSVSSVDILMEKGIQGGTAKGEKGGVMDAAVWVCVNAASAATKCLGFPRGYDGSRTPNHSTVNLKSDSDDQFLGPGKGKGQVKYRYQQV